MTDSAREDDPPSTLRWTPAEPAIGTHLDKTVSAGPQLRELMRADIEGPPRRRIFLPLFLFVATCLSTFLAGALDWNPAGFLIDEPAARAIGANWTHGLIYMASVIGILLTHEMGHFIQTVR